MSKLSMLSTHNLCFSYGKIPIIKDVNINFTAGQFYGIIGPNGCGKTTLLDLLTGNKKPYSGSVQLNGSSLDSYSKKNLAQQLALVPQEFDTGFSFSVEEVVLMGRHPHIPRFASSTPHDWQCVDNAMKAIGIADLRNRHTNTLSGGQKQRTIVARALAQDTPLLLFDEATSSLDIKYTLQIFNLARDLVQKQNRMVIAVMHNLNLAAAYCDEILIMKDGQIVTSGPTEETLNENIIEEVFEVKSNVFWDEFNQTQQICFKYR